MKPPPYGRELAALRATGAVCNVFIYCGVSAWRFAQARPPGGRLAVPEGTDWRTMDFACVRGLELMVIARGWDQDELDDFGRHLIQRGVRLAVGLLVTHTCDPPITRVTPTHYRPEPARRAAA